MSVTSLTKSKSANSAGIPNWKKTPYKPTPDEIIDAFEKGKIVGMSEHDRILMREFSDNLSKACLLSEKLFRELNKQYLGFNKRLFLKVNGLSSFDALFVVDRNVYISNSRNDAFNQARKIKKESKEDFFSINFSFLPESKNLDLNNIFYDGYSLAYEPSSKSNPGKA